MFYKVLFTYFQISLRFLWRVCDSEIRSFTLTGLYNFGTRSVAMPFVYDGYGFTSHARFGEGKLHLHSTVKVSGTVCSIGSLHQDFSGKEMMI